MLIFKARAGLLGLLAVLLLSLSVTATADAQGPFWYHRSLGGQGKGVKISAQEPEQVRGGGGAVVMEGKLAGNTIEIAASQVQVKGIIYNNSLQGQSKIELAYVQPTLVKPAGSHCAVIFGASNMVKVYGHLAWTWDLTATQLKEQPQLNQTADWILLGHEIQQGATELPKTVFTSITLKSSGGTCLLASQTTVEGSLAASIESALLGKFGTKQWVEALPNGALQHFWNGKENIGVETSLKFASEPIKLVQVLKETETFGRQGGAKQEVALYES